LIPAKSSFPIVPISANQFSATISNPLEQSKNHFSTTEPVPFTPAVTENPFTLSSISSQQIKNPFGGEFKVLTAPVSKPFLFGESNPVDKNNQSAPVVKPFIFGESNQAEKQTTPVVAKPFIFGNDNQDDNQNNITKPVTMPFIFGNNNQVDKQNNTIAPMSFGFGNNQVDKHNLTTPSFTFGASNQVDKQSTSTLPFQSHNNSSFFSSNNKSGSESPNSAMDMGYNSDQTNNFNQFQTSQMEFQNKNAFNQGIAFENTHVNSVIAHFSNNENNDLASSQSFSLGTNDKSAVGRKKVKARR
jgi:hypothetical protein